MISFPAGVLLSAATGEELLKKVVEHAAHQHGVTEVAPELAAKVKAAMRCSLIWATGL